MGFVKTDTIGITIMSEKIIKWGFIGCGEVTKTKSGPAFQKVEHSEVVAVMSRDGAKAKAYAKERGIKKWYDDAQETGRWRIRESAESGKTRPANRLPGR